MGTIFQEEEALNENYMKKKTAQRIFSNFYNILLTQYIIDRILFLINILVGESILCIHILTLANQYT